MARLTSLLAAVLAITTTTLLLTTASASPAPAPHHHGGHACKECISSPNNCDITAPCSSFGNKLFCGCRPGYRASGVSTWDLSKQWRITTFPGHEHRVWVAPGVVCDQLCTSPFGGNPCMEVSVQDKCLA